MYLEDQMRMAMLTHRERTMLSPGCRLGVFCKAEAKWNMRLVQFWPEHCLLYNMILSKFGPTFSLSPNSWQGWLLSWEGKQKGRVYPSQWNCFAKERVIWSTLVNVVRPCFKTLFAESVSKRDTPRLRTEILPVWGQKYVKYILQGRYKRRVFFLLAMGPNKQTPCAADLQRIV